MSLLDEEWVKLQYDWMVNRMEEAGYENYEFSNFSKPGFHALNNANYWKGKAYMGIGLQPIVMMEKGKEVGTRQII